MVWLARLVESMCGKLRSGMAGRVRHVGAWFGSVWLGTAGMVCQVMALQGMFVWGLVRQARSVTECQVRVPQVPVWLGRRGK